MKANELMIGDWVRIGNRVEQITKLKEVGNEQQFFSVYYYHTEDKAEEGCCIDEIQPIPLTAEILEKNGFICKGAWMISGEDLGLKQCGDYFKLLPYYYDYNTTGMCDIYYVHELQHALKLCGIDKEIVL